ncbi:hypothetical protein Q1695_005577 [Nippostrongylus brasiliensis]|nr:hypothetical protein Q1695_005577 [Nippostrongylus brasiliensis]
MVITLEKREILEFFNRALDSDCPKCRSKGFRFCCDAVLTCAALAVDYDMRHKIRRRYYVRPSHVANIGVRFRTFDSYLVSMDEDRFHEYTRLTPQEFAELYSKIAHRLQHSQTHAAPVSPMHRLAITLRFLGHGMSFKSTAHEVNLGDTTVRNIVYECCRVIFEELHDDAFPPVTEETWRRSAQRFHNDLKYPRAVGCIDGKHIRCRAPDNSGSTFYNYKGFFSIVLLAVVDSEHRILGYDLGGNGRESDSAGLHVKFHYDGYSTEQDYDDAHRTGSGKGFKGRSYGESTSFKNNGQEQDGNGKEERSFYESSSDDSGRNIRNEGLGKKLGQAHPACRGSHNLIGLR